MTIVGVSANTSFRVPGEAPTPLLQSLNALTPSFVVRVAGPAASAAPALARVIERTVPGAGSGYFATIERVDHAMWPARAAVVVLAALAGIGLVLALMGLCGMSIYNVTRRTQEIGIRMALGATSSHVTRLMLGEGLSLVGSGVAIGSVLRIRGQPVCGGIPFGNGITSADPLAFTAMLATLLVTATISVWFPARRAARIEPLTSLRAD